MELNEFLTNYLKNKKNVSGTLVDLEIAFSLLLFSRRNVRVGTTYVVVEIQRVF